jgi:hypothetical protein
MKAKGSKVWKCPLTHPIAAKLNECLAAMSRTGNCNSPARPRDDCNADGFNWNLI